MDKKNKPNKVKSFWSEKWAKYEKEGFETRTCDYFISNHGRIKSVQKATGIEALLKGTYVNQGFLTLKIRWVGNTSNTICIHIFTAEKFVTKPSELHKHVIHIDGNKKNNHYKNLKWLTKKENVQFRKERGDFDHFIKNTPSAKLTESKVRILKKFLKQGKTKKKILAKQFGISTMQINKIASGENWGYVK